MVENAYGEVHFEPCPASSFPDLGEISVHVSGKVARPYAALRVHRELCSDQVFIARTLRLAAEELASQSQPELLK